MTPDNLERRKNDQEFRDSMLKFMSRIDQRNIDKDLNYAVQEDLIVAHETRITCLEHKATRIETIGLAVPAFSSVAWAVFKLGQVLHIKQWKP